MVIREESADLHGGMRSSFFLAMRQRMHDMIHMWSHKYLSFGGRLALIKSTLATIPLHIIRMMELPHCALHQLEQLMGKFFSYSIEERRKMHMIN